ncbi:MAG TPA: type II toxin-antitoxin system Phd/YefM family antitoxin [Anaerolineales bacterium]|nr:type II toxin-antitoxin system Phd/YefM family antitoxin [Anaerolineales bacterium]
MSEVTVQLVVTREVQDLDDLFRLVAEGDRPVLLTRGKTRLVSLPYDAYLSLQSRIEDLKDLLAMREADIGPVRAVPSMTL